MSVRSDLLKEGIVALLKEYDAYIDDELPDYILVMIANKKTMDQIREDLQLFLTNNTDSFMEWLESVLHNPSLLESVTAANESSDGTPYPSSPSSKGQASPDRDHSIRKRRHDHGSTRLNLNEEDKEVVHGGGIQRIKLPPDPLEKKIKADTRSGGQQQPWPKTKDQDLRNLIRQRKGEVYSDEDGEGSHVTGGVSSVVQLPSKKERVKRSGGTGRLLQKAISDINSVSSSSSSLSRRKRKKSLETKGDEEKPNVTKSVGVTKEMKLDKSPSPEQHQVLEMESKDQSEGTKKKKKSIRERLDSTPEQTDVDIEDELTRTELATLAAVRKVLPQKHMDLRHFLKTKQQSVEKPKISVPSTTRFVVTLDTSKEDVMKVSSSTRDEDDSDLAASATGTKAGGLPEKCKFWPNCKNGDSCPYHHPTIPCRMFPKCKYGSKCSFVHPLCKFNERCTNPACYYLHSVPKQTHTNVQQPVFPIPMTTPFSSVSQFSYNDLQLRKNRSKYPVKSALSWTPGKS